MNLLEKLLNALFGPSVQLELPPEGKPIGHNFVKFNDIPPKEPALPVEDHLKKDEPPFILKEEAPTPLDKKVEAAIKKPSKVVSKLKNVEKDNPTPEQLQATNDLLSPKSEPVKSSVPKSKKVKSTKKNKGKKK